MLQFILGRTGTGKTQTVYAQIHEAIHNGTENIIMLIPDQVSLETEKAVLELLGATDKQKVNVFGFGKLCRYVFEQTQNPPGAAIDNGTRAVVMSRTLDDLEGKLRLLNPRSNRSLTRLMLSTMTDCKKGRVSTDQLRDTANAGELGDDSLKSKLLDTADILDVFYGRLSQTHVDPLDDIDRAGELLLTHPEVFSGFTVYIDGYSGFNAQQLRLVEYLISACDRVTVALTLDPDNTRDEGLFSASCKTYARLKQYARSQNITVKPAIRLTGDRRFHNDELKALEAAAFRGMQSPEPYAEPPEHVFLYPAQDRYDECEYAAREIQKLVTKQDYRYAEIAVIAHDTAEYSGIIHSVFDKYHIPCFLDEHKELDVKPIARVVNALFRMVLENFERSDFILLLKSGLLPYTDSEIRDFEDYIFVWNIDNNGFKKPFTQNSAGFGAPAEQDFRRDNAEKIRREVMTALLSFREASKDCTAGRITENLYTLLTENFHVRDGMDKLCRRLENGEAEALSDEQVRIWELFSRSLDRLVSVIGEEQLPLRRYYELLTMQLNAIEFAEIPRYLDSVIVTNAQRVRDPHYRAVFLIGCTDGVFPANPSGGGLFSEYELQLLLDRDLQLSDSPTDFANLETFMAYNSLCAASDLLYLSYPKLEIASGGMLKPSVLVTELCRIFPKLQPTEQTSSQIYSDMLINRETAFEAYALSLQDDSADLSALRSFFEKDAGYKERLAAVESAVERAPFALQNPAHSDQLFGKVLVNSASKVQTFYQCPFRYFCAYGLRVDEKRRAEIDPIERGNLVHSILEQFFKTYPSKAAYTSLTVQEIHDFVEKSIRGYLNAFMGGGSDQPGSFDFQLEMLLDKTVRVIQFIVEELENSGYDVEDTELDFPEDMRGYSIILPDGHEIRIRGKVDRVDISAQKDGRYIRIIDYKSKSKAKGFNFAEVYYGLDLQMLIYLIAIIRNGAARYGDFRPGGVLYSNVLFNGFSETESREKTTDRLVRDAFKLRGLYLDKKAFKIADKESFNPQASTKVTPDELEMVFKKVDMLISRMGENLYGGVIPAQPFQSGADKACDNCAYTDVCAYRRSEPRVNLFAGRTSGKRRKILEKIQEDIEGEVNGNA